MRQRLDLREILDALESRYYQIEASVAESSAQDADGVSTRVTTRHFLVLFGESESKLVHQLELTSRLAELGHMY